MEKLSLKEFSGILALKTCCHNFSYSKTLLVGLGKKLLDPKRSLSFLTLLRLFSETCCVEAKEQAYCNKRVRRTSITVLLLSLSFFFLQQRRASIFYCKSTS